MDNKFFKHKGNYNFEYLMKTDAFSFSGTFTHTNVERCKTGRVKSTIGKQGTTVVNRTNNGYQG